MDLNNFHRIPEIGSGRLWVRRRPCRRSPGRRLAQVSIRWLPDPQIAWLPAVDPAQPWGKELKHMEGRSFLNVPGTIVCLYAGIPAAVFEQKGKVLRIFESEPAFRLLEAFVYEYDIKRVYPEQNRILIREYPPQLADALIQAGFIKEMQDFVKYRGR